MRIKNYSSLICSLALLILQGCKSPVVELSGIPTYLLDPLTISKEYECYSYSPFISRSDRELSNDSVYSKYVRFKDGWFTLRFIKELKNYEIRILNSGNETKLEQNSAIKDISYGDYSEFKDRIILTDSDNGLKITLKKIANDTLQADEQCFPFLKGKKLFCQSIKFDYENESIEALLSDTIQGHANISQEYAHNTGTVNGIYISNNQDLFLLLSPDTTYRYYVCGLLLSEGTWTQKGQRIELRDKHLLHTFYGNITNQGILSGYWPGDMEGSLLKRTEK